MAVGHRFRQLAYSHNLTRLVRALGLRRVARTTYGLLFAPRDGVFPVEVAGVRGRLAARTPQEFRVAELMWVSERDLIGEILGTLHAGDVFFDIGANRGLFTIMAGRAVGPAGAVYAFEPDRGVFALLQSNIAFNELTNVRTMPLALSDHSGRATLSVGSSDDSVQVSRIVGEPSEGTYDVEIAPADALDLPVPAVIKIDVEGHEYAVLRGMATLLSQPQCRALFCEVHPDLLPPGVTSTVICDFLRSVGFSRIATPVRGLQLHLAALK